MITNGCAVEFLEVFADGSGAPAHVFVDGKLFACDFVAGEARVHPIFARGEARRPARAQRAAELAYATALRTRVDDAWLALHAALYADLIAARVA